MRGLDPGEGRNAQSDAVEEVEALEDSFRWLRSVEVGLKLRVRWVQDVGHHKLLLAIDPRMEHRRSRQIHRNRERDSVVLASAPLLREQSSETDGQSPQPSPEALRPARASRHLGQDDAGGYRAAMNGKL
jgi:hypothetical protein